MAAESGIEVAEELTRELDPTCGNSGQSRHGFVRDAFLRQLQRSEFEELSAELRPYAKAQGWTTDEDVFQSVS